LPTLAVEFVSRAKVVIVESEAVKMGAERYFKAGESAKAV
jgi:hypothetical protein